MKLSLTASVLVVLSFCVLYASSEDAGQGQDISHETELRSTLLTNYDKNNRPVKNAADALTVNLGLYVLNIIEVDERHQNLILQVWQKQQWTDEFMKWNPDDYNGVNHFMIPASFIWIPDLTLFNSVTEASSHSHSNVMAVVRHTGEIVLVYQDIIKAICFFDLNSFPYDKQTCELKYGSWTHDGFRLDPQFYDGVANIDVTHFTTHHHWQLTDTSASRNVEYRSCCEEPFPTLIFKLTLTRNGDYFVYLFVVPAVLIGLVTPFLFLMSSRQKQKFILGGCLLIALAVLLTKLFDVIPAIDTDLPNLGRYYVYVFSMLSIALLLLIITTNIMERQKTVPSFVRKIVIKCLGRFLRVNPDSYQIVATSASQSPSQIYFHANEKLHGDISTLDSSSVPSSRYAKTYVISEWAIVAIVIDRLFFLIFVVLFVICSIAYIGH